MKYLRALGLLGLATCLALLVAAGPASAALNAPPGADRSDWTGVELSDCWSDPGLPGVYPNGDPCEFVATSPSVVTTGSLLPLDCRVDLYIRAWQDGETEVYRVDVTDNGSPTGFLCPSVVAEDLNWPNQICQYTGSEPHQYWDAIKVHFTIPAFGIDVEGTVYAQLHNTGGDSSPLDPDSASLDSDVFDDNWMATDYHLNADFEFAEDDADDAPQEIGTVTSTEDPCKWVFEDD